MDATQRRKEKLRAGVKDVTIGSEVLLTTSSTRRLIMIVPTSSPHRTNQAGPTSGGSEPGPAATLQPASTPCISPTSDRPRSMLDVLAGHGTHAQVVEAALRSRWSVRHVHRDPCALHGPAADSAFVVAERVGEPSLWTVVPIILPRSSGRPNDSFWETASVAVAAAAVKRGLERAVTASDPGRILRMLETAERWPGAMAPAAGSRASMHTEQLMACQAVWDLPGEEGEAVRFLHGLASPEDTPGAMFLSDRLLCLALHDSLKVHKCELLTAYASSLVAAGKCQPSEATRYALIRYRQMSTHLEQNFPAHGLDLVQGGLLAVQMLLPLVREYAYA